MILPYNFNKMIFKERNKKEEREKEKIERILNKIKMFRTIYFSKH
jgi:hypothetical protein